MRISRRTLGVGGAGLLAGSVLTRPGFALENPISGAIDMGEDLWIALEAYAFLYPLVTMEMTRRVVTNVAAPAGTRAPMGHLIRLREYPNAQFRDVTAPNADTLYTTAFVDVGAEPWIVSIPDLDGRYALFPMLDAWTTVFAVPGERTSGTGAQTWAIVGPNWTGELPAGVTEHRAATDLVWLLGRIYCTGTPEDYAAVHAIQDAIKLVPLSAWGQDWAPPAGAVDPAVDMKTPVRDQVNALTAEQFFTLGCELLKTNPPVPADAPVLERIAAIGIVPGQDFDASRFDPAFAARIPELGFARIMLHFKASDGDMRNVNGWSFTTRTGSYGTDYLQRALIAAIGLGANLPQDAVYPTSTHDGSGLLARKYSGAERYVLTFPKGLTPPVGGFWSLTMYDDQYFFVDNPLNRYSISARQDLNANSDGSIDILIQHDSPGADREANWLPAPAEGFILMMRLYWPNETAPTILDGSWVVPQVRRVG